VLKEGDLAPEFSAMDHAGNVVKLSDLKGQKRAEGLAMVLLLTGRQ